MSDTGPKEKTRMSTGLRIVFGLSLALNLLVVAAIGGAWVRHGGPPRDGIGAAGMGRVLYRELPREERRALRQTLRQSLDRNTIRQGRIAPDVVAALRADPFDPMALRALLIQQSSAMKAGQDALRAGWLSVVDGMSDEERLAYADRLSAALDDARKWRRSDKP